MPDATSPSFPMPIDVNSPPTNSHLQGLNSPAVSSPLSQKFEFSTPQMGHSQIPDLKNVMFPSDNPFAYPNQPISTLEAANSQFGFHDSGPESYPGSSEASMMGTPAGIPGHVSGMNHEQPHHPFDVASMQGVYSYGGQVPNYGPQHQMYDMPGQMSQEEYWTRMGKGNVGTRTGFTPGASVNLDELFGGDGWAGMWEHQG